MTAATPSMKENMPLEAVLLELLTAEMVRRLREKPEDVTAAEMAQMRQLLSDNSITLASVRQGDFGSFAQNVVEEEYPFGAE